MRYVSITNRPSDVEKATMRKPGAVWVVTPKYHGTNFSFSFEGEAALVLHRRNGVLKADDKFYGAQTYMRDVLGRQIEALRVLSRGEPTRVFGELYGGGYPHPDVLLSGSGLVQRGIYYSHQLRFVVFDIFVGNEDAKEEEGEEETKGERGHYLDFSDMRDVCRRVGLPCVSVLKEDDFDVCLTWAQEHRGDPAITDKGLPPIEGNTCEGFVLRPKGRILGRSCRLKVKSDKFLEEGSGPAKKKQHGSEFSAADRAYLSRICEPRFASVASKELPDEICSKNIRKLGALLVDDAREHYDMAGVSSKAIKREVGMACAIVAGYIRTH